MKELWQNEEKVAFTTMHNGDFGFAQVGDIEVMEITHVAGPKYRHTASFIVMSDAMVYLRSKYPGAEVKDTARSPLAKKEVAANG